MLSQFDTAAHSQRKKRLLGHLYHFPEGCMAVGRLDETSEGLLLITTDGALSHHVNTSSKITKEYFAQVDGELTLQAVKKLSKGVSITVNGSPYVTKPCEVRLLAGTPDLPYTNQRIRDDRHGATSWVSITLGEGKFRQVRKMTSAVGFPTLRLARVRIGALDQSWLNGETVEEISDKELRSLIF